MIEIILVIVFLMFACGIIASCGVAWYGLLFIAAIVAITLMGVGAFLMITCAYTGKVMQATGKIYDADMERQQRLIDTYSQRSPQREIPQTVVQIAVTPNRIEAKQSER